MAVSRVRTIAVPWGTQPQEVVGIDRSTPAGRAITTLIPFNGQNIDLVTGRHVTLAAGGSIQPTPRGLSLRGSGASARASIPIDLSGYRVLSMSFWMYWDAYSNDDAMAMEFTANINSQSGAFSIDPNCGGPVPGVFQTTISESGVHSASSFPRPSAGAWHHYAFLWDRDVVTGTGQPALRAAWVDGVAQTNTTQVSSYATATNFANSTLYFLSRGGSSLLATGNLQNVVLRAGYRLSDAEALREFKEPWGLYEPQQISIPVPAVGGAVTTTGTSTGTLTLSGTSAGVVAIGAGASSGTVTLTGTSVATTPVVGTSSGTITLTGTSVGTEAIAGTSSGTFDIAATSTGALVDTGTLVGTTDLTGTATAVVSIVGESASQTITLTGTATGATSSAGASSGTVDLTGSATGVLPIAAVGTDQTITLTGTATGLIAGSSSSYYTFDLTGTATGTTSVVGTSDVTIALVPISAAVEVVDASTVGAIFLSGTSAATVAVTGGAANATITLTGTSTGLAAIAASSAQQIDLTGFGFASASQTITSVASFDILAASAGTVAIAGASDHTLSFTGVSRGTVPTAGGSIDPGAVWSYVMPNGMTAGDTLVELHAMLRDLYRINGLETGTPLVVTATERSAGAISQLVGELAGTVTVTRQ